MYEEVVLVNENDEEIGFMEKLEAHQKGLLHRAFSVFLFNDKQQLLLQQRAFSKYHSAGLWTNTCCSHPRKNEPVLHAANRRLQEEMGIASTLTIKNKFIYHAPFDNGLIEHELDYILTGFYSGAVAFNTDEVAAVKWVCLKELVIDCANNPEKYTVWFKHILNNHLQEISVL